jgi:hypothetical protein
MIVTRIFWLAFAMSILWIWVYGLRGPIPENCVASPPALSIDSFQDSMASCRWNFVEYRSSEWEKEWVMKLEERKFNVCETFSESSETERAVYWLSKTVDLVEHNELGATQIDESIEKIYSTMQYELQCSVDEDFNRQEFSRKHNNGKMEFQDGIPSLSGSKLELLIEPLVGNTRDPFTVCPLHPSAPKKFSNRHGWDWIQSKRHLLLMPYSPIRFQMTGQKGWSSWSSSSSSRISSSTSRMSSSEKFTFPDPSQFASKQGKKVILFDLGSALYGFWPGSSEAGSTKWFVDHFQSRHSIKFTHIYAFEYTPYNPFYVWASVPEEILPYYHYINVGVEVQGRFNPWNIIKRIATQEDYIIVKLDIDNPSIENSLMTQLKQDPLLLSLIDEMAYEHHVHTPEMMPFWGNLSESGVTLSNTYEDFLFLRKHGIRMHSWP